MRILLLAVPPSCRPSCCRAPSISNVIHWVSHLQLQEIQRLVDRERIAGTEQYKTRNIPYSALVLDWMLDIDTFHSIPRSLTKSGLGPNRKARHGRKFKTSRLPVKFVFRGQGSICDFFVNFLLSSNFCSHLALAFIGTANCINSP